MECGRCSPSRQSVFHEQSTISLALTAPQQGGAGAARTMKRGERANGSKGNPAREGTISNPADFTDPALGGPGSLFVSLAFRSVVHAVFYRPDYLCDLPELVPVRAQWPGTGSG